MASRLEDEDQAADGSESDAHTYDVARLLTFSDGVFAIAITLLVLSIPVPELAGGARVPTDRLPDELLNLLPRLTAYTMSFVLVGLYWMRHHQMMRGVKRAEPRLLWFNLLLLLFVCLLPFSTGLMARYGDTLPATEVYAANLVMVSSGFSLVSVHLVAGGQLPRQAAVRSGLFTLAFLTSMVVAPWRVQAAWAVWLAVSLGTRVLERTFASRRGGERS